MDEQGKLDVLVGQQTIIISLILLSWLQKLVIENLLHVVHTTGRQIKLVTMIENSCHRKLARLAVTGLSNKTRFPLTLVKFRYQKI